MRWRMIDKVDALKSWCDAHGIKTVSLEEYELLAPLGREGECPEGFVLESAVALVRWLVSASSAFQLTGHLGEVERFDFARRVVVGDVLEVRITVMERRDDYVRASASIAAGGKEVASGVLRIDLHPLAEYEDAELLAGTWSEIYVSS